MRRTDRLFEIMQLFRDAQFWRGQDIANRLEVSLRTVYRDIETLIASGVPIEGERGVGYLLREPIFLPPLTLTHAELEALQFGMEIVKGAVDEELSEAASQLFVKINSVLPANMRDKDRLHGMAVYSGELAEKVPLLGILRQAIGRREIVKTKYLSLSGSLTARRIHPLHVEYWGQIWTCTAWCEKRNGFRAFRVDHFETIEETAEFFQNEPGRTYVDYLAQLDLESE